MPLIIITAVIVVAVIAFIVILYAEQRDKEYRRQKQLPARKYHDITDYDVTTVYTIRHK